MRSHTAYLDSNHNNRFTIADPLSIGFCEDRLARITPAIRPFIEQNKIPGALTLIAREGALVHCQSHGYADVDTKTPVTQDTVFRIFSMTKPVTAVTAMMLYEEGLFSLDDPIAQYLPAFTDMRVMTPEGLVPAKTPITIRQCLTHSSGLTYSMMPDHPEVARLYGEAQVNEVYRREDWSLEEHTLRLAKLPLIAQPGTAWRYSEGLSLVARLIEVLTGQAFGVFLQERIFNPLGMIDTAYQTTESNAHRLATLYEQSPDLEGFAETSQYGGDFTQPAKLQAGGAGLVSTAPDYLCFAQMLLNEGEFNGTRLLSPKTARLLMSDQFDDQLSEYLLEEARPLYKGVGHGFAGTVVTNNQLRGCLGSDGEYSWSGWASTNFWVDPKEQLVAMVLTQLIPQPDQVLGLKERFRQVVYQALTTSKETI